MAKEVILSVKTGQAVKSIGELRENIKYYKKALDDADLSAGEHQAMLARLQENQAALRNAMHATTATFADITRAATAANVAFDNNNKLVHAETLSYNELVRELDILKQQWRATTNQAERSRLTEQITAVNDRLKEMDKSVGVFGRNVGNYIGAVDHLTAGLQNMGRGAAGLAGPLRNATMGFKTLSATPAVAILGVLASVLQKVIDAMKTSEKATDGLTQALAPFQAIGDAITKMLQGMANAIVGVVGWFGKLTTAILGNNKAAEERLRIAKEQDALDKAQRETLIANAEAERDIAELRAKATDREKYSARERLAMLEEAGRLEAQIAERAKADAEARYKIIKDTNALTESSKGDLEKEAQAYADMVKAQTNYYQQVRTINAGIIRARREEAREAREAAKAVKDAATAKISAEKEYLQQLLSIVKQGSESEFKVQNTIAKKEYELQVANARQKITDRKELNRTLEMLDQAFQIQLKKNREEYNEKQRQAALQELANFRDGFDKNTAAYMEAQIAYLEEASETLQQKVGESDQAFLARRIEANEALKQARLDYQDWQMEQEELEMENRLTLTQENQYLEMENEVAFNEWKLAKVREYGQLEGETEAEFRARDLAAERAYNDSKKKLADARRQIFQTYAGAVSSLLGGIADLYEADTKNSKQSAERAKNIKAAMGIIDTISGAISAFRSGVDSGIPAPYNMILGAVQAAAVTAAGLANVAKIKATPISDSSSSSGSASAPVIPAAVEAPTAAPQVQNVRTLTGVAEEERLNEPQRVYILSSDLEADRNARQVQVAETTF